jgi:hypothetical protein
MCAPLIAFDQGRFAISLDHANASPCPESFWSSHTLSLLGTFYHLGGSTVQPAINVNIAPSTPAPSAPAAAPVVVLLPLTGRIEADLSVGSILGHIIVWVLLIVCTFGVVTLFYPYALAKLIINRCTIIDGQGRKSRLKCDLNVGDQIGHMVIWFFIIVCTFGIGIIFYYFKVFNVALNHTRIES